MQQCQMCCTHGGDLERAWYIRQRMEIEAKLQKQEASVKLLKWSQIPSQFPALAVSLHIRFFMFFRMFRYNMLRWCLPLSSEFNSKRWQIRTRSRSCLLLKAHGRCRWCRWFKSPIGINRVQRYHHAGLVQMWPLRPIRDLDEELRKKEASKWRICITWIVLCLMALLNLISLWTKVLTAQKDFQEFWSGIYETEWLIWLICIDIPLPPCLRYRCNWLKFVRSPLAESAHLPQILVQPCLATSPVMEPTARATATRHTRMGRTATAIAIIPMAHLKAQATTMPTLGAAMDSTHPNQTLPVVSIHHTPTTAVETRTPGASRRELSSRGLTSVSLLKAQAA